LIGDANEKQSLFTKPSKLTAFLTGVSIFVTCYETTLLQEKLLHPSKYGAEEWLIVILLIFIVFVIIKHLIFHTLYFWWYHSGQFYIPNKFWTIITGECTSV